MCLGLVKPICIRFAKVVHTICKSYFFKFVKRTPFTIHNVLLWPTQHVLQCTALTYPACIYNVLLCPTQHVFTMYYSDLPSMNSQWTALSYPACIHNVLLWPTQHVFTMYYSDQPSTYSQCTALTNPACIHNVLLWPTQHVFTKYCSDLPSMFLQCTTLTYPAWTHNVLLWPTQMYSQCTTLPYPKCSVTHPCNPHSYIPQHPFLLTLHLLRSSQSTSAISSQVFTSNHACWPWTPFVHLKAPVQLYPRTIHALYHCSSAAAYLTSTHNDHLYVCP